MLKPNPNLVWKERYCIGCYEIMFTSRCKVCKCITVERADIDYDKPAKKTKKFNIDKFVENMTEMNDLLDGTYYTSDPMRFILAISYI